MIDDIILNKIAIIHRCLERIHEEYQGEAARLQNFTLQDAIVLNIQRACQATIDLAMHLVAKNKLGLPQDARDAFDLLKQAGLIDGDLAKKMKAMVGFRNIAIHDYQAVNPIILINVLEKHLPDFTDFIALVYHGD